MTENDNVVVPEGPGSALFGPPDNWEPGFSTLTMDYANNGEPHSTRAVINIVWTDFDRKARTELQVDLTAGDLVALIGVASALHAAAREDDRG